MMAKRLLLILIVVIPFFGFTQDFTSQWQGHFSYLDIKDVSQGNNKLFAAAENAVFVYDTETLETSTISTVHGLSGEVISQIHYSEVYELLIVGYENGLMEIVFDNDDDVLTIVDILEKPTIAPDAKIINHFNEYNGLVYISTDYGISVYDLERLEFGDTYFMGNGGSQIIVKQTTIFNDFIYAACRNGNGLKRASIFSNDLVDFNEWETVLNGNNTAIENFDNKLFLVRFSRFIAVENNGVFMNLFRYEENPLDTRAINNYLIITTKSSVYVYDIDFNLITQIEINVDLNTEFTSATSIGNHLYIGTKNFGVLKYEVLNSIDFEEIHPEGPLLNNAFRIEASPNNLWLTYGEYSLTYNWFRPQSRGISHLIEDSWINIPNDSVLGAQNLNTIAINPFNSSQVFISSFADGVLEVNDNSPTVLYNNSNSALEPENEPGDTNYPLIRQCASGFDRNGVLWTMTGRNGKPLKSYDPSTDQWQRFDFLSLIQDPNEEWGYSDIIVDNNGTKWIGGYNFGLIGFNENNSGFKSFI